MKKINQISFNAILDFVKPFTSKLQRKQITDILKPCCVKPVVLTYDFEEGYTNFTYLSVRIDCDGDGEDTSLILYTSYDSTLETVESQLNTYFSVFGTWKVEGLTVTLNMKPELLAAFSCGVDELRLTVFND